MATAIVFGVSGQDGFYLTKLLLEKGYHVVGVHRTTSSSDSINRLNNNFKNSNLTLVEGDITDPSSVQTIIKSSKPDEIYNLAAQSHVAASFEQPSYTWQATAGGCFNILEAIRFINTDIKFYQASSSEMFGNSFTQAYKVGYHTHYKFQNERTPMVPRSPYAVAKLAAHHTVRLYRECYGIFACSGILMNHESPIRGENFVTRKITKWIGKYKNWCPGLMLEYGQYVKQDWDNYIYQSMHDDRPFPKLRLGNLKASRDWGHAEDYVRAMWMMMQHSIPDDYVVSSMETHTIEDFLTEAFKVAGIDNWSHLVVVDPKFFRPAEVDYLLGDSSKIRDRLGWKPNHTFFSLVKEMVLHDLEEQKR